MTREDVLARLRASREALESAGVLHAALFGSRARRDNRPDSDTDILVELDPHAPLSVFDYAEIKLAIADLLDVQVDVVNRATLRERVRDNILADAVYAF